MVLGYLFMGSTSSLGRTSEFCLFPWTQSQKGADKHTYTYAYILMARSSIVAYIVALDRYIRVHSMRTRAFKTQYSESLSNINH